jgi:pilus assembly protein CpaF
MSSGVRTWRPEQALVRQLVERAADELDAEELRRRQSGLPALGQVERELLAAHALSGAVTEANLARIQGGQPPLDAEQAALLQESALAEMWHEGAAIDRWLADDSWDNLDCNGHDVVFVSYADGRKVRADPLFQSDDEMLAYLATVARRGSGITEYRFDSDAFFLSLELEDGSRLSAVWGGRHRRGVATRPLLCLRRHRLRDLGLDDLCRLGSLAPTTRDLLRAAVAARANIAVVGATNAGKTTLLRALAREIPVDERVLTIERTRELRLRESGHLDVGELEAREPNAEGRGGVPVAELVNVSLRMNPARLILGEILGPADVTALLNAMSQGNEGSLCTLHASSAEAAFERLISLCMQAPERLTAEAAGSVIASALDLVIFIATERRADGGLRRYVRAVREVGGWDGRHVASTEVCSAGPDGLAVPSNQFITRVAAALQGVGYVHRVLS